MASVRFGFLGAFHAWLDLAIVARIEGDDRHQLVIRLKPMARVEAPEKHERMLARVLEHARDQGHSSSDVEPRRCPTLPPRASHESSSGRRAGSWRRRETAGH